MSRYGEEVFDKSAIVVQGTYKKNPDTRQARKLAKQKH